jgi:hypothetical protein
VINPVDDGRIDIAAGGGYQHPLGTRLEVFAGTMTIREYASALADEIYVHLPPGQSRWIVFRQPLYPLVVDIKLVATAGDITGKSAVHAIVFKQVRIDLDIAEVIDRNDLDFVAQFAALIERADDITTNAAKTINSNFYH